MCEHDVDLPAVSKHTPGPWKARLDETYTIRDSNEDRIAQSTFLCRRGRRHSDEVAANTRLMAAAPDMLEILRDIRVTLPGLDGDKGNLFDRVRAAIAKAEGT